MLYRLIRTTLLLTLCWSTLSSAQFKEEWSVSQPYLEWGHSLYDFNADGTAELTKQFLNYFTAYNGADSFRVLWSLTAPNHDKLVIDGQYELNPGQGKRCIFTASNSVDTVSTRILSYKPLSVNPEWQTADLPGFYSVISVGELDSIPGRDVVVGINQYVTASSSYRSKLYILNGLNGKKSYESGWISGYMIGPYTANMDEDPEVEVLLNLYFATDTTSALRAYSFDPVNNVLIDEPLPNGFDVSSVYPNPFNSTVTIPITLVRNSEIDVRVTDINGREVATLFSGMISAGKHSLMWDGKTASGISATSGTYFCRIRIGNNETVRPMVILR